MWRQAGLLNMTMQWYGRPIASFQMVHVLVLKAGSFVPGKDSTTTLHDASVGDEPTM
jgi:hypothetical protein